MKDYLAFLRSDIYPQPPDEGHSAWGAAAIGWCLNFIQPRTVLDVGCAEGQFARFFKERGVEWSGVNLPLEVPPEPPGTLFEADMSDLGLPDGHYDLIFARHTLEHSPCPLVTLMEWHRVASSWLMLVLPAPDYWGVRGRNHYSVLPRDNWLWLLERAGWKVTNEYAMMTTEPLFLAHYTGIPPEPKPVEFWFLCERTQEVVE